MKILGILFIVSGVYGLFNASGGQLVSALICFAIGAYLIYRSSKKPKAELNNIQENQVPDSTGPQADEHKEAPIKVDEAELDLSFPETLFGEDLAYKYTNVKIFTPPEIAENLPSLPIGKKVQFYRDLKNAYDENAVLIESYGQKIGYIYKNGLQRMVLDWLEDENPISAKISSFSSDGITIDIAFYRNKKPANSKEFTLTGNRSASSQENISLCSEGDEVEYSYDYEKEKYEAICGDFIGYFPSSADSLLEKEDCQVEIYEIIEDDNGKMKVVVSVMY